MGTGTINPEMPSTPLSAGQAEAVNDLYDSFTSEQYVLFDHLEKKYGKNIDVLYDFPENLKGFDAKALAAYDAAVTAIKVADTFESFQQAVAAVENARVMAAAAQKIQFNRDGSAVVHISTESYFSNYEEGKIAAAVSLLPKLVNSFISEIQKTNPKINSLTDVEAISYGLKNEDQARFEALKKMSALLANSTTEAFTQSSLQSTLESAQRYLDLTNSKIDARGNLISTETVNEESDRGGEHGQFTETSISVDPFIAVETWKTPSAVSFTTDPASPDPYQMLNIKVQNELDIRQAEKLILERLAPFNPSQNLPEVTQLVLEAAVNLNGTVSLSSKDEGTVVFKIDLAPDGTNLTNAFKLGEADKSTKVQVSRIEIQVPSFEDKIIVFQGSAAGHQVGSEIALSLGTSHGVAFHLPIAVEQGAPVVINAPFGFGLALFGQPSELQAMGITPLETESLIKTLNVVVRLADQFAPQSPIQLKLADGIYSFDTEKGNWKPNIESANAVKSSVSASTSEAFVDLNSTIENKLQTMEIKVREPIGDKRSAFGAEFVTLEDGSIGLLKPVFVATTNEELTPAQVEAMQGRQDEADWITFLKSKSNGLAEVAAYLVDKKLGTGLVPVTVVREIDGVKYTLQSFSNSDAKEYYIKGDKVRYAIDAQPISLAFFDTLIGHIDRHNENYLTNEGVVVAIDNGASFTRSAPLDYDINVAVKAILAKDYNLDKDGRPLSQPFTLVEIEGLRIKDLQLLLPEQSVFNRLNSISEQEWRSTLESVLPEAQINSFLDRVNQTVETINGLQAQLGYGIFRSGEYSPLVRNEIYRESAINVQGSLDLAKSFRDGSISEHPLAFSIQLMDDSVAAESKIPFIDGARVENLLALAGANLLSIREGNVDNKTIISTQVVFTDAALAADRIFNQSFVIPVVLSSANNIQTRDVPFARYGHGFKEYFIEYENMRGERTELTYILPDGLNSTEAKAKMQDLFGRAMTKLETTVDQTASLRREFNLRLESMGMQFDHDGNLSTRSAANDSLADATKMASEATANQFENSLAADSSLLVKATDASFEIMDQAFAPGSSKTAAIQSLQNHLAVLDKAIEAAKAQMESNTSVDAQAMANQEIDFAQHIRQDLESSIREISQWKDQSAVEIGTTNADPSAMVNAAKISGAKAAEIQAKLEYFNYKLGMWQADLSTMEKFDVADIHGYAMLNYEMYKAAAKFGMQEFEVMRAHLSRALSEFELRTGAKVSNQIGDAVFQFKNTDRMKDYHSQIVALEIDPVYSAHPNVDDLRHAIIIKKMETLDGAIKSRFDLDLNKPADLAKLEATAGKKIFEFYTAQSQMDLNPKLQQDPESYLAKVRADIAARQQLDIGPLDTTGSKQVHMAANFDITSMPILDAENISASLAVLDPHTAVDVEKVKAVKDGLNAKIKVDPMDGSKPALNSNEGWNFVSKIKVGYDKVVSEVIRRTSDSNRQRSEANYEMYGNLGQVSKQDNYFNLNESLTDLDSQLSVARHEMVHVATNGDGLEGNSRQILVMPVDRKIGLDFIIPQKSYSDGFRVDEIKAHIVQIATEINSIRLRLGDMSTGESAESLFSSVFINSNRVKNFVDMTAASYSQAEIFVFGAEILEKKSIHPDNAADFKDFDVYRIPILGPNIIVTHYLEIPVRKDVSLDEVKLAILQTIQAGKADLQNMANIASKQNEYMLVMAHVFKDTFGFNPLIVSQTRSAMEAYGVKPLGSITESAFNLINADATPKLKLAMMKKQLDTISDSITNAKQYLAGIEDLRAAKDISTADAEELKTTLARELGVAANARSRLVDAVDAAKIKNLEAVAAKVALKSSQNQVSASEATEVPAAASAQFKPKMEFAVKWTAETAQNWVEKLENPITMTFADFKKLAVEFGELKSQVENLKSKYSINQSDQQLKMDYLQTSAMKARIEQLIVNIDKQIEASDASYGVAVNQNRMVRLNKEDAIAGTTLTGKVEGLLNGLEGNPQLSPQLSSLLKYMPVLTTNAAVHAAVQYFALNGISISADSVLLANQATSFDISELRNRQYFDGNAKAIVEASIKVSKAFDTIRISTKAENSLEGIPAVASLAETVNRQVDSLVPPHLVGGVAFQLQAAEFRVAVEYRAVNYDQQIDEVKRLGLPDSDSLINRIYEQKITAVESEFLKKYPQAVDAKGQFNVDQFINLGMAEDVGLYGRIISSNLSVGIKTTEQITKFLADIREKNAQMVEIESKEQIAARSQSNLHLAENVAATSRENTSSTSRLASKLNLFLSLTGPSASNVQEVKAKLANFNSENQMKLMVDEINRIYNSARVEFKSDAVMADAGGSVNSGEIKMNINESGKDPFALIGLARHEAVHIVTNAQGIAGNARQIYFAPSVGGKIKFASGDDSYSSFLRLDEIRAHMMNIASDVGAARLLMGHPNTVVEAQKAFARANMNIERLNDFYALSIDAFAKAEKSLLYSEQLPIKVTNLDGSVSLAADAEFYSIPITEATSEVIFMTVPVKAALTPEETLEELLATVQAAKNDVGNSLSTSIRQKQYLQMLEAVYAVQTGVDANSLRPSRIDSDKIDAIKKLRGENPGQLTTKMIKAGEFTPVPPSKLNLNKFEVTNPGFQSAPLEVDLQLDEDHIRHSVHTPSELRDGSHHIEALSVRLNEVPVVGNSDSLKVFDNQNAIGEKFLTYSYMVEVPGKGWKVKTSELPIDSLTGTIDGNIPSGRNYFEMRMRENPGSHVAFIDVGSLGFVNRNYAYGANAGDVYLAAVADVIKSVGGDKVVVMKNGGDEFALLILETDPQKVQELMQKISDSTSTMNVHQISLMENAVRAEEFQKAQYRIVPEADPNVFKAAFEKETDLAKKEEIAKNYQAARAELFATEEFKQLAQAYKQNYVPYSRESLSMGSTRVGANESLETVLSRSDEAARLVKVDIKEAVYQDATKQRGKVVTAFEGEFASAKDLPINRIFNPKIPLPIESPVSYASQQPMIKLNLEAEKLELKRGKEVGRFSEFSVAEYINELGEKTYKVETYFDIANGQRQVILHDVGLNSRTNFLDANTDQAMQVLKAVVQEKPGIGVVWVDVPVLGLVNYFKDGQVDGDALLLAAGKAVHSIMRDENIGFKFKGSEFVVEVDAISATNIAKVQARMESAVVNSPEVKALFAKQREYLEQGLITEPDSKELKAAMETLTKMETGEIKIVNVLGTVTQKGDTLTSVLARTRGIEKLNSPTGIEEGKATARSGVFEENIQPRSEMPDVDAMAMLQKVPDAVAQAIQQQAGKNLSSADPQEVAAAVQKLEDNIQNLNPTEVIKLYEKAFNTVREGVRRFEIVKVENRYGAATIGGKNDSLVEIASNYMTFDYGINSEDARINKKMTLKSGDIREFTSIPKLDLNSPVEFKGFSPEALAILGHEFLGHVVDFRNVVNDPTQPFLIRARTPIGLPVSYPTAVYSELNGFKFSADLLYQAYAFSMNIGDVAGAKRVVKLFQDVLTQAEPITKHFQELMEAANSPQSQAIIERSMYFSTSQRAHSDKLRVVYFSVIDRNGKIVEVNTEVPDTMTDLKTSTSFVKQQLKNGLDLMPSYQNVINSMKVQSQAIAEHFAAFEANAATLILPKKSSQPTSKTDGHKDFDITEPASLEEKHPTGIKPDSNMNGRDNDEAASFVYERKAGQKLAKHGYEVRYSSDENLFDPETRRMVLEARRQWGLPHNANFDLLVEGKPFDVYSPKEKTTIPHMVQTIKEKSEKQTGHLVLYARERSGLTDPKYLQLLRSFLREGSMNGQLNSLQEVLVVQNDGSILRIFPPQPPRGS